MRILITSGGTKVPIDPIRSITNRSTGQLGSKIAKAALIKNAEVIYVTSLEGQSPFCETFDCYSFSQEEQSFLKLKKLYEFCNQYRHHYSEYRYNHYDAYSVLLKKLIEDKKPDVVILAAAVSDYLMSHYSKEKIRSGEDLHLQLKTAPKLIQFVKKWLPNTFLVGFKLLIDASDSELLNAALESMALNQCDLIAANNLSSLEKNAHEILLIERDGTYQKIRTHLAESIIERVMQT
jgi:phosphopantothenate---cysteine ligase (CTP)